MFEEKISEYETNLVEHGLSMVYTPMGRREPTFIPIKLIFSDPEYKYITNNVGFIPIKNQLDIAWDRLLKHLEREYPVEGGEWMKEMVELPSVGYCINISLSRSAIYVLINSLHRHKRYAPLDKR